MVQRDDIPEEVMDRELWLLHINALEDALLGSDPDFHSFLPQTDEDFINDATIAAGDELRLEARAPGGGQINGQAVSTGVFSIDVEWLNRDGAVVRTEGVASNREADRWANYALDPKSPYINIVIINDTSSQQTVSGTLHYR